MLRICYNEIENVEELMEKIKEGKLGEGATLVFEQEFEYVTLQGADHYTLSEDVTGEQVIEALVKHVGLQPHIT